MTRSACYFAVRVLTDPDIPPSAGATGRSRSRARGSLLNARPPAAVVGGNVETSCRVADVVLKAFGRALGQGTMNNLTLGSEDVAYYETIGGGQGACADADGPSGVHVAMSNTLNTPVEALELEFPLRAVEYSLRRGSGGAGRHRGGDGVIRELEALEPLRYSLITERRRHAPPGADGGEAGARAATCSTATSCPRRRPARWRRVSGSGSKPPAAAGMVRRHESRVPRTRDHGIADGGEPRPRRVRADGLEPDARAAEDFGAAHPGVTTAATPADAATDSELVFTMVVDGPQVEAVLLDEPHGAAATERTRHAVRRLLDDRPGGRRVRSRAARRARGSR